MGRVKVVDTYEDAKSRFETFHRKNSTKQIEMPFGWPSRMQEIGVGQSEMYRSNKWQVDPKIWEDYKHVAEGPRLTYQTPGFLRDWENPSKPLKVHGSMVELEGPMPRHFTILAPLLGVQLRLFQKMPDGKLFIPKGDDGLFEVRCRGAMLGGAKHPGTNTPFLFVYTKDGGVHLLITGEELDVKRDGIVG